jgi:GNAT superfamily N-acetyltransferase
VTYRIEPLAEHDVVAFSCGIPDLDVWLQRHARTATGHGTRTSVLVDEKASIIGYFALAPHYLERRDAPPKLARGATRQIPAVLLTKLALDASVQGQGLGGELLVRALEVIVDAARKAGGRVVLVDAIDDDAVTFYLHHDFELLPGPSRRLVMKLSTAATALGLGWP